MIRGYSEHAANERAFLAWVRTGLAVIAFGFVVEKFNVFIRDPAVAASAGAAYPLERLSSGFGRYDGTALISLGVILIVVQSARFTRTRIRLDDGELHTTDSLRSELTFSAVLVLLVTAYATYTAVG